jgi:hypothetical protein
MSRISRAAGENRPVTRAVVALMLLLLLSTSQGFTTTCRTYTRRAFVAPHAHRKHTMEQPIRLDDKRKHNLTIQRLWDRMDTLKAAGFKSNDNSTPVLLSRGGGLKAWVIFLTLAWCYKWYRARFINKVRYLSARAESVNWTLETQHHH